MEGRAHSLYHRVTFWVADTLHRNRGLALLALELVTRLHRRRHAEVPLVLVTGSAGKTTTRRLIAAILARQRPVVETRGNDNIDLHVHRYVRRSRRGRNQVLVLESGIQSPANPRHWSRALDPDVFVLTNIGDSHLAWLGDRRGVLAAKLELARRLRPTGVVVLNVDDPLLAPLRKRWPRVTTFGLGADADVRAVSLEADADGLRMEIGGPSGHLMVRSPLLGRHHAPAILAAVACATIFDVPPADIVAAIEACGPERQRLTRFERNGLTLLDDTYNANPASVQAALDALALQPGRPVAVLADMLDLGEAGPRLHSVLGREIAERHPETSFFLYGSLAKLVAEALLASPQHRGHVEHTSSKLELLAALERFLRPGDSVLVKGSRGMRMEEIAERLGKPVFGPVLGDMHPPRLVGRFGAQRDPERCHAGVDLPTAVGTPLCPLAAGEVTTARFERWYGKVIRIRHFANVETTYAHLDRIEVRRGQRVEPGDTLGRTGRSAILHTGNDYDYPHLHFELRVDGVPVDPTRYLFASPREE
jgi:UDP-N-acetylmuramoyl-tripeptide--D-alanyl-D-alanine ligase